MIVAGTDQEISGLGFISSLGDKCFPGPLSILAFKASMHVHYVYVIYHMLLQFNMSKGGSGIGGQVPGASLFSFNMAFAATK